ncbi:MAG: hypothetical protein E6G47_10880 [Actinobacteria bacterium]|nr:MAG: hypothetical protein E6G47_10880 [Actinomycetota bacterium]
MGGELHARWVAQGGLSGEIQHRVRLELVDEPNERPRQGFGAGGQGGDRPEVRLTVVELGPGPTS